MELSCYMLDNGFHPSASQNPCWCLWHFVTAVFNVNVAEVVGWHSKGWKKASQEFLKWKTQIMGIALERTLHYSDGPASTNLHPVYTLCLCSGAWVRSSARRNCRSHCSHADAIGPQSGIQTICWCREWLKKLRRPPLRSSCFFCLCLNYCRTCWILLIRRHKGFRGEESGCHFPTRGRPPKESIAYNYLICLVFAFPARCQSREDKDGVVSQNDFMIFMKDVGGQMVLSTDQRVQSVEIFWESSRCC